MRTGAEYCIYDECRGIFGVMKGGGGAGLRDGGEVRQREKWEGIESK